MLRVNRIAVVHWALVLFAAALIARAAQVQLWQRERWAARAERQHYVAAERPAPRGAILDAAGTPLAVSREMVKIAVSTRDVRDRRRLARLLAEAGVKPLYTRRITDPKYKWVDIPGRFLPSEIATVLATRGVRAEPVGERVYVQSDGLRRVIGRMDASGAAVDGIELALDSILRGSSGTTRVARDSRGARYESPDNGSDEPRAGHIVTLTINRTLQDITDRALSEAVSRMSAAGGDIVVIDPASGEVLAMATRRSDPRSTAATALTEPFQPGSTLKPFVAAALLSLGKARPDEWIETFDGSYRIHGRTITDVHAEPRLTLDGVLRHSSNVGIVRFAERLTPREQYEWLRDFGFGAPTGVPYPSETPGILYEPKRWSKQSAASLAIGYELAVTPLQLAMAYGAIANGGELLSPSLIREVRSPEGRVIHRARRRVVRRVITPEVAGQLRSMLIGVVDSGTATEADLLTFAVGGKSGTARGMKEGRYVRGSYTATYVGLFPADRPQFVVLVKLDDPQGAYYGGKTAAPVSKVVIQAALAARDAALDRGQLAERRHDPAPRTPVVPVVAARREIAAHPAALHEPGAAGRELDDAARREIERDTPVSLPSREVPLIVNVAERVTDRPPPVRVVPIPDVRGLPLRRAVHRLHQSGFRVRLVGGGDGTTAPPAGTPARTGTLVRLAH